MPATITAEHHDIGITLPVAAAEPLIAAGVARVEVCREGAHAHEARRRW